MSKSYFDSFSFILPFFLFRSCVRDRDITPHLRSVDQLFQLSVSLVYVSQFISNTYWFRRLSGTGTEKILNTINSLFCYQNPCNWLRSEKPQHHFMGFYMIVYGILICKLIWHCLQLSKGASFLCKSAKSHLSGWNRQWRNWCCLKQYQYNGQKVVMFDSFCQSSILEFFRRSF